MKRQNDQRNIRGYVFSRATQGFCFALMLACGATPVWAQTPGNQNLNGIHTFISFEIPDPNNPNAPAANASLGWIFFDGNGNCQAKEKRRSTGIGFEDSSPGCTYSVDQDLGIELNLGGETHEGFALEFDRNTLEISEWELSSSIPSPNNGLKVFIGERNRLGLNGDLTGNYRFVGKNQGNQVVRTGSNFNFTNSQLLAARGERGRS